MSGPPPKRPDLRQRRNRTTTAATLAGDGETLVIPDLPARGRKVWHPFVIEWWRSVQTCEMRGEYLASDLHGLYILADLWDQYWRASKGKATIAAEIRQQAQRFGLSPIDRRRLQWEVDRGGDAPRATPERVAQPQQSGADPRSLLSVVS